MRRLILTIDLRGAPPFQCHAMVAQLTDWAKQHKDFLGTEDLLILNVAGPTALYWLDGDIGNPQDVKTLEEIKEKLQPILKIALEVKVDNGAVEKIVQETVSKKMTEDLRRHREKREGKQRSRLILPRD